MKKRTKEILEFLLNQRGAWDKKGNLDYAQVIRDLYQAFEITFYDEYYWPKVKRFCHWLKVFRVFLDAEWDRISFGYMAEIESDWAYNVDIPEIFECVFYDDVQVTWDEWFETPMEEAILALGIRPPLVWPKEVADGVVQLSML